MDKSVHSQILVGEHLHRNIISKDHVLRSYSQYNLLSFIGGEQLPVSIGERNCISLAFQSSLGDCNIQEVHWRKTDKACNKEVGRCIVELERSSDLLYMSHGHTDDPISKSKSFRLVMGYIEHCSL